MGNALGRYSHDYGFNIGKRTNNNFQSHILLSYLAVYAIKPLLNGCLSTLHSITQTL